MSDRIPPAQVQEVAVTATMPSRLRRLLGSDLWYDFTHSPVAMVNSAPCVAQTIRRPSAERKRPGTQSSGVPICGQALT